MAKAAVPISGEGGPGPARFGARSQLVSGGWTTSQEVAGELCQDSAACAATTDQQSGGPAPNPTGSRVSRWAALPSRTGIRLGTGIRCSLGWLPSVPRLRRRTWGAPSSGTMVHSSVLTTLTPISPKNRR